MSRLQDIEYRLTEQMGSGCPRAVIETLAAEAMAIADARVLLNLQDVADRLHRDRGTVRSWHRRGQHSFPEPAGRFGSGIPYWDGEVIEKWIESRDYLLGVGQRAPVDLAP